MRRNEGKKQVSKNSVGKVRFCGCFGVKASRQASCGALRRPPTLRLQTAWCKWEFHSGFKKGTRPKGLSSSSSTCIGVKYPKA